jgi:hypothetical protein
MSGKKIIDGLMEALNMSETIKKYSDEDLLRELVRRNGVTEGPAHRTPHEYEVLLGIGKDNYCYITLDLEDLVALTGRKP